MFHASIELYVYVEPEPWKRQVQVWNSSVHFVEIANKHDIFHDWKINGEDVDSIRNDSTDWNDHVDPVPNRSHRAAIPNEWVESAKWVIWIIEHMTNMCNTTHEWYFKYVQHHSWVVFKICAAPETRGVALWHPSSATTHDTRGCRRSTAGTTG